MIKKIYKLLSKHDMKLLFIMICFSILVSFIEILGITVIMPFISVENDFSIIHTNKYYQYFDSDLKYVSFFGIMLIIFYIFRGFINLTYTYYLSKFNYGRYHIFSYRLFDNYLNMYCNDFLDENIEKEIYEISINKTLIIIAHRLSTIKDCNKVYKIENKQIIIEKESK